MSLLTQFYNCPSNGGGGGGTFGTPGNNTLLTTMSTVQVSGPITYITYYSNVLVSTAGTNRGYWLGSTDGGVTVDAEGITISPPNNSAVEWGSWVGNGNPPTPMAGRSNGSVFMPMKVIGTSFWYYFGNAGYNGISTLATTAPAGGPSSSEDLVAAFYVGGNYGYVWNYYESSIPQYTCGATAFPLGGSGGTAGGTSFGSELQCSGLSCRGEEAVYAFLQQTLNTNGSKLVKSTNGTTWTTLVTYPFPASPADVYGKTVVAGKWGTNNLLFVFNGISGQSGYSWSTNDGVTTTFVPWPDGYTGSILRACWSEPMQAYYFFRGDGFMYKTVDATGAGGATKVTLPDVMKGASFSWPSLNGASDAIYVSPIHTAEKGYVYRYALT